MKQALLAAAVVLVAAGCGGAASTRTTSNTTTTTPLIVVTHGRYHYPQTLIASYMKSCESGGRVSRSYCACTLDRLSNRVSTQDFVRIGLAHGRIPARIRRIMRRSALACAGKL